jgi:hypothetical protein
MIWGSRTALVGFGLATLIGVTRGDPATQPTTRPSTKPAAVPEESLEPLGYAPRPPLRRSDDFLPVPDRWRIGLPGGYIQNTRGSIIDPYNQNILKGDYAFLGQDKFLVVTATSDTLFEARRLPVPSGVSTLGSNSFDFFGSGVQQLINENVIVSVEIFQGDASYKPRDWELRFTPVFNLNYTRTQELNLTNPDVRNGRYREDGYIGMQELFVEKHLADVSPKYDFVSVRAGIQGFTSDFRGFLFSDNEPGIRLFGNLDNNRTQFNLAWFSQLEKDTNSGLNGYTLRDQNVFIANIYRQDFIWEGYTAQLSFHANFDNGTSQLDENGFLVRPAPIGTIEEKDVRAYYLGWAGDGHIGRFNLTHQFYEVLGTETFNPTAGHEIDINAQFFAAELSYDQDWRRYRASFVWASGDSDPTDGTGRGFDSIFDNPNFAGGGFSFFTRQVVRLTGAGVNLVNRNSFLPDLRTSKEQGQANFVNPGLFMYNLGMDMEITPKTRAVLNATYLQFADTEAIKVILHDDKISRDIGVDLSIGVQYRPFLNNNAILTMGAAALIPGQGFKDIYDGAVLYSTFFGMTFTY